LTRTPSFWSLAFVDIPQPDFADVIVAVLPAGATSDAGVWARTFFSVAAMPPWVRASIAIRQLLAPLMGVPRANLDEAFRVDFAGGEEATLSVDDVHLDFRVGVGVDSEARLVRITTAVRLKGWRGRLYFLPVRIGHPLVVQSMLARTQKLLGPLPVKA